MSKPDTLKTKIFLDSADPSETRQVLDKLGFLDGQTTNPTLLSKNPELSDILKEKNKLSETELLDFYRQTVQKISSMIPTGSISVEVYADEFSSDRDLIVQAENMNSWISNAHIKLPIIKSALKAGEYLLKQGIKLNFTLAFNQKQAAAVHVLSKDVNYGDVFYSSFIGRLFDKKINGIVQLKNVMEMFQKANSKVMILAASFRSYDQFLAALSLKPDIITASREILLEWEKNGLEIPEKPILLNSPETINPETELLDLNQSWEKFDIENSQTADGLQRFAKDWNDIVFKEAE